MKKGASFGGLILLLILGCGRVEEQDSQDSKGSPPSAIVERASQYPTPKPESDSLKAEHKAQDSLARAEYALAKRKGAFCTVFKNVDRASASISQEVPIRHQVSWVNDSLEARVTSEQNCCTNLGVNAIRQADTLFLSIYNWGHTYCKCVSIFAMQWKGHVRKYGGVNHVMFENYSSTNGWEELPWSLNKPNGSAGSSK